MPLPNPEICRFMNPPPLGFSHDSATDQRTLQTSPEQMNGETLSQSHGYPVRALIPGIIGARSVKWLDRITVSRQPSQNFYQQHDYKVLPPDATSPSIAEEKDYWSKVPAMMDNQINSVIGDPEDEETVRRDENGKVKCRGYAIPGGDGGPVVKVEVSGDEGGNWVEARLGRDGGRWSWRLWECEVEVQAGEGRRLFSKATDRKGNVQMEERSQWNLRGYVFFPFFSSHLVRLAVRDAWLLLLCPSYCLRAGSRGGRKAQGRIYTDMVS